jgi:hypothetical protein
VLKLSFHFFEGSRIIAEPYGNKLKKKLAHKPQPGKEALLNEEQAQ